MVLLDDWTRVATWFSLDDLRWFYCNYQAYTKGYFASVNTEGRSLSRQASQAVKHLWALAILLPLVDTALRHVIDRRKGKLWVAFSVIALIFQSLTLRYLFTNLQEYW